jgi:tetratricopeptide (TPR) repeat protein
MGDQDSVALAHALIARREYRRAAETLERLAQTNSHPSIQQDLGLCHFCLGEYDRAKTPLESAYRAGERSTGLLRLLVATHHHLGHLDEAVAIADANPASARSDAALAGAYALVYLDRSRPDLAAQWAKAALALDSQCVDALTVQGTLSMASAETEVARASFESVLAVAPGTGRAWVGLGSIALLQQDFSQAVERLEHGVQLMPGHTGSWHVLAWAHLLAGDLQGAERAFQKALALDRNFAETHGGLAAVAALRGNRDAAQQALETALRLDRGCLSAQFARSVLAGHAGDPIKARAIVLAAFARLTADPAMAFAKNLALSRSRP